MSEFKVSIVSSNEEIFSGTADMLYATGSLGEIGIAPGHSPLLTGLMPGPVRVCNDDKEETQGSRPFEISQACRQEASREKQEENQVGQTEEK